jgi:hypothetical protein
MGKTDELDRMLIRLPSERPEDDLAKRVYRYVQIKRRRKKLAYSSASLLLAAFGLWLSSPLVTVVPYSGTLSGSGFGVLGSWLEIAFTDLGTYITYFWNSLTGAQNNINTTVNTSILLGITALAISVMIALGQLLPGQTSPMSKGAKA